MNKHFLLSLLIAALALPALAADPADQGPLAVTREEYNFGDSAYQPPGFPIPVEVIASVHYPTGLPGGPYPLVVFMHGRHSTCYAGQVATLAWPCQPPTQSIPSYKGYDYISSVLASWGYVVVSVSANGINAVDNSTADAGMSARANLIQYHLGLWKTFSTTGGSPFGTKFVGKVNMNNIGTMGHSRGGEGVVTHYVLNTSQGSPYGIKAVFPLAPVDFFRPVVNNAPMAVALPYCDGDVSDLQGVHYYDDTRYNVAGDPAVKNTIYVLGANHNFFNTIWTPGLFPAGTADDWLFVSGGASDPHCGPGLAGTGRLTDAQQRSVGLAYIAGFFRWTLGGEDFKALFSGDQSRPASIGSSKVWVSYHAGDTTATRRDVNRLLSFSNLRINTAGGAASQSGVTPYNLCGGNFPQPSECIQPASDGQQPHTTGSGITSPRGLSQLRAGWSSTTANYNNDLPSGARNVSSFSALVFRAGLNWGDALSPVGQGTDLTITLSDGAGAVASTTVSPYSSALFYPPGSTDPVPKLFLNTIRIPLSAFTNVNLTDIRRVTFKFDQRTTGALAISDIAFVN